MEKLIGKRPIEINMEIRVFGIEVLGVCAWHYPKI
jgi:hypothetical protein